MTINRRSFLLSSGACLAASRLFGQQALPFGSPGVTVYARPRDYSDDLARYITRLMNERREQRARAMAAVMTRAAAEKRIRDIRAKVWELLGEAPEKTPLNPQIFGTIERDGYRIHKLIYESRPRLYVTSNLYVPNGRGPFPAVLSPLGHSANGKTFTSYQNLFHTLARKGYVVLAYDPFGQGERIEYPGAVPGRSSLGSPTDEHDYAGKRLLLLGVNFALFRAWDGIRGIDYLLTRDDVDPKRIGCGGQSGGGTMTMYLAALDERINAAVVSEGNTENVAQVNFEPPGAVDDAEQNLVPSLVYGFDRFDLLHAIAPRPLMITISNKDAGTTYGPEYVTDTLRGYEEVKKTYQLLSAESRVSLVETAMGHGYGYEQRRASYGFYNQWLHNTGQDDAETPITVEPDERLWCTKAGFVGPLEGESSFTLTRRLADQTRPTHAVKAATIAAFLGIETPLRVTAAPALCSTIEKHDHVIEEVDIPSEAEIHVPCWVVREKGVSRPKRPGILVVPERSKDSFVGDNGSGADVARAGYVFCAIDVRGRGQATPRRPLLGPRYYTGRGEEYYVWDTLMAGSPMLAGYVRDILAAFAYLKSRPDIDPSGCWIVGQGTMGVAALLALALEPSARGGILQGALSDYRSIVDNDRYRTPFNIFAYGLLKHFDLPDVAAAIAPRPLLLMNPVNQNNQSVLEQPGGVERLGAMYPNVALRAAEPVTPRTWLQWIQQVR